MLCMTMNVVVVEGEMFSRACSSIWYHIMGVFDFAFTWRWCIKEFILEFFKSFLGIEALASVHFA